MRTRLAGARKALIVVATVTTLVVSTGVISVLAVHDESFQLDGDVIASTATSVGGAAQAQDWDSVFTAAGAARSPLPTDFRSAGFKKDFSTNATTGAFVTSDTTTYATGSKDTLPISGWQCNFDNNVNSKIDVMNAYAAKYVDPASGDEIMYFALERNTNTGDANVGFWFLQQNVGCETSGASATFTGAHQDGDVLVVSQFSGGGTVSTITAYQWEGGADGALNTTPIATAGDCRGATFGTNDPICGVANIVDINTPWPTANFKDKVGTKLRVAEFFEGGINLTDTNLGGRCFNTFIGDTRSSTSLTATLFDFAAGTIGECTSTTATQAKDGSGANLSTVAIPATGTLTVQDTATVNVGGVTSFNGDVTFYLCGPSTTTISSCSATTGAQIGTAKTITANGSVTSDNATLTSVGSYCWTAVFSGDAAKGVPGSQDNGANECFTVTPLTPTLSTQATSGPVNFGQSITDTISLTGTANKPGTGGVGPGGTINTTRGAAAGGTIRVDVYGPNSCAATAIVHSATLTVTGDSTAYGGAGSAVEFTPTAPGEYIFVASYNGDSPNTLGVAATPCASQPAAEKVTVRQIPTTISTAPNFIPNDSATITSSIATDNLAANGTITFSLYGPTSGATALQNCTAGGATGRIYTESILTGPAANSVTKSTSNTTAVSTDAVYYWLVTYAPPAGDTAHTGRQSSCAEIINVDLTGDAGPGTLFP